jgi:eukaryotic-like serine/threonine-protein kinase
MFPKTGDQIGPYRLVAELGRGGMSVVWLAEHDETQECVALKTQEDVDPTHLARLRREITTLSNLAHPGIVGLVEHGHISGVPWYAMDLLSGRSLSAHLMSASPGRNTSAPRAATSSTESLPPPRLLPAPTMDAPALAYTTPLLSPLATGTKLDDSLRQKLGWAADICHTLAYLHGEGVVHCDVKPQNIYVSHGGRQLVLADFGLASRVGTRVDFATLQSAALVAAGTVDYIAPERIKGLPFDARADLYSLGCMLYEIVTGRVPFQESLGARVLVHHLSTPPRPPSALGFVVPASLERVILQLLAKEPRNRPGHVQVVLHVLEELGVHRARPTDGAAPRPYLYKPTFTGRAALISTLQGRLDEASRNSGSITFVGGESGVGKTTVATELVKLGRIRQVQTFTGQCAHLDAEGAPVRQAPLSAFLDVLRHIVDHCRAGGQVMADIVIGDRGPLLTPLAPFVATLPGQQELPRAAPLPAALAQRRLFDALLAVLDAHAMGRPMVLVLDDLQWADELSLSLLEYLAGVIAERSWVVVGLYRSEDIGPAFARLLARDDVHKLELSRLPAEDVGVMMAEMLGMDHPPPALFQFVSEQSEGNPFFVAEYLQLAVAKGVLLRDAAGQWALAVGEGTSEALQEAGLPASVQALVDDRMARIEPGVWRWGEAAAVVGREVDQDLLPQILAEVPEVGVGFALSELQSQGILEERPGGRVRFVHDKFRQAAYDRLGPEDRRALHRRAARVLASRDAWREDLGWHWQQAGDVDEAVSAWLDGAQAAAEAYAYGLAKARISSAIDLMPIGDPRTRRAWLLLVDNVLLVQGDHERALDVLRGLIVTTPEDGDLSARLGRVLLRTGHIDAAQEALESARTSYRKAGDQTGEALTLQHLARCRHLKGLWDEALSYYVHTLELSRWLEDTAAQASTMQHMATLHRLRAENEKALNLLEDALDIHRELGDTRGEARVMLDRARVFMAMGRYGDARPLSRAALRMLRRVGDRPAEAACLAEVAKLQRALGNLGKSEVLFHEALRIFDDVGDRIAAAEVTCELASILRDRGTHDAAIALYDDAKYRASDTGGSSVLAYIQQELAELFRRRGELDSARDLLREALATHHASGDVGRQTSGLMRMARLHASAGERAEADAAYVGALERTQVSNHRAGEVSALLGRAELACANGQADRALEWVDQAHTIVQHDQLDALVPTLYGVRGLTLGTLQDPEAARFCEIAIRRAARSGDRYGEARALFWWATKTSVELQDSEREEMLGRSASLFESGGYLMAAKKVRSAMANALTSG